MESVSRVYEVIEEYFEIIVKYGMLFMEGIGVVIILVTGIRCICAMTGKKRSNYRLILARGISLALEFKMGGEVLRTVLARDFRELGVIGCLIGLRAALAFLLYWEIRNEKREEQELVKPAEQSSSARHK